MPISRITKIGGTQGTKLASGTTAQRGSVEGEWRYNSETGFFEGRNDTSEASSRIVYQRDLHVVEFRKLLVSLDGAQMLWSFRCLREVHLKGFELFIRTRRSSRVAVSQIIHL